MLVAPRCNHKFFTLQICVERTESQNIGLAENSRYTVRCSELKNIMAVMQGSVFDLMNRTDINVLDLSQNRTDSKNDLKK